MSTNRVSDLDFFGEIFEFEDLLAQTRLDHLTYPTLTAMEEDTSLEVNDSAVVNGGIFDVHEVVDVEHAEDMTDPNTIYYYNGTHYNGNSGNKAIGFETINGFAILNKKNQYVTPEMYGAIGDDNTDDTVAIQAAFDDGRPVFMANKYHTTEELVINNKRTIMCPGEIRYTGNGSAVVITTSYVVAYFNKITSAGNGIEMRPIGTTTHASYNCNEDIITIDTVYCIGQAGIGLYLNATDGLIQFCKFNINRIMGEWNTRIIDGIKIKATNATTKYCNGNIFNIASVSFTDTAFITDTVLNSCFDNVFKDLHFEQNNTAIDASHAKFVMSARFDPPTHGVIKINDNVIARIEILSAGLNENTAFEVDPSTNNSSYHFVGPIIDSQGNSISNELYITKWGIYAPDIYTPTYTLYKLRELYGRGAIGYLNPDSTIKLPAVRLAYAGNPCSRYTYKFAAPSLGSCTAEFTDGTTQTITWDKYSGVLEVYPTRDGTSQTVVVT